MTYSIYFNFMTYHSRTNSHLLSLNVTILIPVRGTSDDFLSVTSTGSSLFETVGEEGFVIESLTLLVVEA